MTSPAETPEVPSPKKRGARRFALLGLKLLVTAGLLGALARSIATREGMDELGARAADVALAPMLAAVGLHFVAVLAGVLRWRVLLIGRGIRLPFGVLLRSFLVGRFLVGGFLEGRFLVGRVLMGGHVVGRKGLGRQRLVVIGQAAATAQHSLLTNR